MDKGALEYESSNQKKQEGTYDPLVSIITPVLNGIKYLEECIQSVLNQDYPYIEHVFVDGGSSDGTLDVLTSYRTKHPDRVRFVSEPDKGACDAWNKGLKIARGGIFGWLGSDDTYEPDAVMAVVEFFRSNPDAYFVFGDCNNIDEKGQLISRSYSEDFNLEKAIKNSCAMFTPSVFFKREVVERVGFMDPSLNVCDFDFYLRAGKVFHLYRIDKVLANFRMHEGSITGAAGSIYMYARENFMVARRHGASIFCPRARNYLVTMLTRPIRPILVPIYRFKPLRPILVPLYHFITGRSATIEYFDNHTKD